MLPDRNNRTAIENLIKPGQVHRDVYIAEDIFNLEMKHLFTNSWIYVGHDSQTPNPGDYHTARIGSQSVIQIRLQDGAIRVLYNRCPHKGTRILNAPCGHTGKFFRCPYHAWTFRLDGSLLAIPMRKDYENSRLDQTENVHGMKAVAAVEVYRGFVFARMAPTGISFDDYFGDSLSSIDNMVDRAPAQSLEIVGTPLRYMHRCNWKMLVENQTDTCHPMVVHESSAGTAMRLWNEAAMLAPETPKPAAMEIIAPFMSPYAFFEKMGLRVWPNGHGHTGVHHSIHSDYSAIPGYFEALAATHGEARTRVILSENRHNTVYFPNIMIKGPIQQLRNFIPLAADRTLVESWIFRLKGAPDQLLARTALYNRMINAPTSIVGHDDQEAYERAQNGLHSDGLQWVNMQRQHHDDEAASATAIESGTSERQMRNQFEAWRHFMTSTMPATEAIS